MSTERDVVNGYENESPRPIGWLYYHPETYKFYYANGTPNSPKYLFDWDFNVTWNGTSTPTQYRPFITKGGDVVFVWRGDLLGTGGNIPNVRKNPIVYPNGNYDNPVEVKLPNEKPTSWFSSTGADYIYSKDIFMFAEYTRSSHEFAHVWKVTKPFTDPNNWKVVKSFELSGTQHGMKHCHALNYDTFSGAILMSTGDDDDGAKIFMSTDFGETWQLQGEGDTLKYRLVNFICTKDKIFWARDSWGSVIYWISRNTDGYPDFSVINEIQFEGSSSATAILAKIDNPNGLLILDENHISNTEPLPVYFLDLETNITHKIHEFKSVEGVATYKGFTASATNIYQAKGDNRTMVGWDRNPNNLDVLGNTNGELKDRVNNIALEVIKKGDGYELKVTAINDRV